MPYEVAYQDLCKLVNKYADQMTAVELLAVAANLVGKLVAMQDQRTMSSQQALRIVARNMEIGNAQIVDHLRNETKGNA